MWEGQHCLLIPPVFRTFSKEMFLFKCIFYIPMYRYWSIYWDFLERDRDLWKLQCCTITFPSFKPLNNSGEPHSAWRREGRKEGKEMYVYVHKHVFEKSILLSPFTRKWSYCMLQIPVRKYWKNISSLNIYKSQPDRELSPQNWRGAGLLQGESVCLRWGNCAQRQQSVEKISTVTNSPGI